VLDLILAGGLARPDVNKPLLLAGRRVVPDFRWPQQRVVVEADGAAWHDNKTAREDDAERQALLEAHGEWVMRVTWTQAITKPAETLARLRGAGIPEGAAEAEHRVSQRMADKVDVGGGTLWLPWVGSGCLGGIGWHGGARYPEPP
jgi:hypothetical protein